MDDRIDIRTEDAHALRYFDASFDAVGGHTMPSHVCDPLAVARVVKRGRGLAIFDGDCASLTFAHPDPAPAAALERALMAAVVVKDPRVMPRDSPRQLLRSWGARAWSRPSRSGSGVQS